MGVYNNGDSYFLFIMMQHDATWISMKIKQGKWVFE